MAPSYCSQCGNPVESDAKFCPSCGARLRFVAQSRPFFDRPSRTNLEYMGFWVRVLALTIDSFVMSFASLALTFIAALTPYALIFVVPGFIYIFYTQMKCQTVGRRLVGIQVVGKNGEPIGFWRGLLRETIGKFLSTIVLYIGFIAVAFSRDKQGWHDKITSTYVVRRSRPSS